MKKRELGFCMCSYFCNRIIPIVGNQFGDGSVASTRVIKCLMLNLSFLIDMFE